MNRIFLGKYEQTNLLLAVNSHAGVIVNAGVVIDSGDGATHIIPVSDGYVVAGSIRHVPLAGRDITSFVQRIMRDRGEPVPPEESLQVAKRIKEEYCYVGADILKEYNKYDADPLKYFKKVSPGLCPVAA